MGRGSSKAGGGGGGATAPQAMRNRGRNTTHRQDMSMKHLSRAGKDSIPGSGSGENAVYRRASILVRSRNDEAFVGQPLHRRARDEEAHAAFLSEFIERRQDVAGLVVSGLDCIPEGVRHLVHIRPVETPVDFEAGPFHGTD